MTALRWHTTRTVEFGGLSLPCAESLEVRIGPEAGQGQVGGIRPDTARRRRLKGMLWPVVRAHNNLLSTGFLERQLGRWIRRHATPQTVFLEVGAGELSLRRFLPAEIQYNGLDIAFSEFSLRRVLGRGRPVNLVLASATAVPLPDNSVSMIACKEVLMYLPDVGAALRELHRICVPGAKFMCTIGNLNCRKYAMKGLQPDFRSAFSFDQFRELAEHNGFRCVEAIQRGWWIPLPMWLSRTTHQLPFTSRDEFDNTNFLYLLEARK